MIRQDLEIRDVKRTMSFDPHISLIICQLAPSLVTQGSNPRATQCVVHRPDALAAAGSLLEMGQAPPQTSRTRIYQMPGGFRCRLKCEER